MEKTPMCLPVRKLLGPGPSNVAPQVLQAMAQPVIGHLDPAYLRLMDEIQEQLQRTFVTTNALTIPISGTGSAGMEAAVVNFVQPGEAVLVGINGFFGRRIAECVHRCGGVVSEVTAKFGDPLDIRALANAAERCKPKVIAVVHAETSTGVLQPLEPIREIASHYDSLLLVDAVTSLGSHPLKIDEAGVDICYSCTQKGLGGPPGLAPLTVSKRAAQHLESRRRCQSWYLDLALLGTYWGSGRVYHHTAPVSLNYALRVALCRVLEEGLEKRWSRHQENHRALVAGVQALGLKMHVAPEHRVWSLNTVRVPDGIDDVQVRGQLLQDFNLEIGSGLGELKGAIWRIGLMGENSSSETVLYFLHALEQCLRSQGFSVEPGSGVQAATQFYGATA